MGGAGAGGIGGSHRTLLGIYLNDHLLAVTAGVELSRRAARANCGTAVGEAVERLAAEIAKDRAELLDMMRALGIPIRHYKVLAGWVGEKLGRLKPNGHIVDRSPLSTLIELETMHLIVEGNGWRVLQQVADFDARLDRERLEGLPNRARQQADTLEALRIGIGSAREIFAAA